MKTPQNPGPSSPVPKKIKCEVFLQSIQFKEWFSVRILFLGPQLSAKLLMNRQTQLSTYSGQLRLKLHTFYDVLPPRSLCSYASPPAIPPALRLLGDQVAFHEFQQSAPAPKPLRGPHHPGQTTSVELAVCFYGVYHQST